MSCCRDKPSSVMSLLLLDLSAVRGDVDGLQKGPQLVLVDDVVPVEVDAVECVVKLGVAKVRQLQSVGQTAGSGVNLKNMGI